MQFSIRKILVRTGMTYALVKFSHFTDFLPVKQSWGYQSLSLMIHPNQYPKVVNSLRGNHHRSNTVILTQNWLKTIVKNQLKQFESQFQFYFVHQNFFFHDHSKWTSCDFNSWNLATCGQRDLWNYPTLISKLYFD